MFNRFGLSTAMTSAHGVEFQLRNYFMSITHVHKLHKTESHQMGEIRCKYIAGKNSKSSDSKEVEDEETEFPEPDPLPIQGTVLKNLPSTLNLTDYDMATIKLWPVINARFIRIRPWKWVKHIALRMELLGNDRPMDHQQIGKVVRLNTVSPLYRPEIINLLRNKDPNTPFIQIDCKITIKKAMDLAGCTTYGMVETDEKHNLLVFTTPDARTSERVMDCLTEVGVGINVGVISATAIEWRNSAKNIEQITVPNSSTSHSTGFYSNIKSHKVIQVVVERIMNSAQMSFDYICMLIIASMIAAAGLAIDSTVAVIASMLVSVCFCLFCLLLLKCFL